MQAKSHKARMIERRERQLARTPGFTPVHNPRIAAMLNAEMMRLTLMGRSPADAEGEARSNVASRLPKPAPTKLYRFRPSKSDSPAYRKALAI